MEALLSYGTSDDEKDDHDTDEKAKNHGEHAGSNQTSIPGTSAAAQVHEEPERRPRAAGLLNNLPKPHRPGKIFAAKADNAETNHESTSALASMLPAPKHSDTNATVNSEGGVNDPTETTVTGTAHDEHANDDDGNENIDADAGMLMRARSAMGQVAASSSAALDEPRSSSGTKQERPQARELYEGPVGPAAPHPASAFAVGASGEWLAPPPVLEDTGPTEQAGAQQKKRKRDKSLDDISVTQEITREQLKHGQERAVAAHMGMAHAYGSDELEKLKKQADSAPGGKAKHKHQINWLYAQAKKQELDIVEGKAAPKHGGKRTSHFTYGW